MVKSLTACFFAGLLLMPFHAMAQSSPNLVTNQVPTAVQWNGYFTNKADATNGILTTPTINIPAINGGAITNTNASSALVTSGGVTQSLSVWVQSAPGSISSSLVTANGGSVGRALSAVTADESNPLFFGADATGILDSATAINQAALRGVAVHLSAGNYYVKSHIALAAGQCLYGDGWAVTSITFGSDFSSSDPGVITLSGREQQAPCVHDLALIGLQPSDGGTTTTASTAATGTTITVASVAGLANGIYVSDVTTSGAIPGKTTITGITGNVVTLSAAVTGAGVGNGDTIDFTQPRASYATLAAGCTTGHGGSGCQYPPVIVSLNSNRVHLYNLWFGGAWDGINLTNTSPAGGGANIHDIMMGAMDIGINMGSMFDTVNLTSLHFYSFGFSGLQATSVYEDGGVTGLQLGRIDGLDLKGMVSWQAGINVTSAAGGSEDPWQFANIVLDGGTLTVANVLRLNIVNSSIVASTAAGNLIDVTGGAVQISNSYIAATDSVLMVNVSAGSLQFDHSWIDNDGAGVVLESQNTASLFLDNDVILNHSGSLSNEYIRVIGASAIIQAKNNQFGGGAFNHPAITIQNDNVGNLVADNKWSGHTMTAPTGTFASGPLGVYSTSSAQAARAIASGSSDTMLLTDRIINWDSASGSAKAESIVGCGANNPGQILYVNDIEGDAATNHITLTPQGGTVVGGATFVLSTNKEGVSLTCDGISNWQKSS